MPTAIDSDKQQLYHQIVKEKIGNREAFSAYDVTREVRRRGNAVEHYLYKETVHQIFLGGQMQDYHRTLIQYPTGPAFLYHPPEIDPFQYAQSGGQQAAAAAPAASAVLPAPATTATDDDEDNEPDEDAEEETSQISVSAPPPFKSATGFPAPKATVRKAGTYLYVPAPMGRHIGLQPGGDAYLSISKSSHEIRISKTPGAGTTNTGGVKVHVDVKSNVRLTQDVLRQAGLGKLVKISIDNGCILVAKKNA